MDRERLPRQKCREGICIFRLEFFNYLNPTLCQSDAVLHSPFSYSYKIIFNNRNKIQPEKVKAMTSQASQVRVVYFLQYTAASACRQ